MIRFRLKLVQHTLQFVLLALFLSTASAASAAPAPTDGALILKSPYGRVSIRRNAEGVPHIRARGENGAQFGLGYSHAQDRLWQMEFQRRLANGRTAEFLGPDGLKFDALFRTVGLRRVAEAAWQKLSPSDRAPLEAYAAGINLYLGQSSQQLPPEFGLLGVAAEPWTPIDVLAFGKLFTWGNGSNWDKELLRGQLAALLGPERAAQLTPAYTEDGPVIVPDTQPSTLSPQPSTLSPQPSALNELLALHQAVAEQTGIGADGRGSNSWVLSGSRTTTGKPLLANDPHLPSQSPALWYLTELSYDGRTVIGATVPGSPGVQAGHNGSISWGVTTINVDSQDLYIEQINDRNEALYQGVWEPLQIVPELIKVKGQPDVTLNVRISRHGPLLSDVVSPTGPALAVRWSGHDPVETGALSALAINRARNFAEFTAAFRDYRATDQNYTYADRKGNIGYITGGTIPLRASGDGRTPVPGWTGENEWTGYLPWEQLPRSYNPPEGYIVSANNQVTGDALADVIGNSYAAPYRAVRIVEMIEAKGKHSPNDMATMQADVLAVHARNLLPLLLRTKPADARGQAALDLLRSWDMRANGDSAATAVFEAWYIRIAQRLFADELIDATGKDLWPAYGRTLNFVGMATETALLENQPWCDDVRTPAAESCAATLAAALSDGLADMAKAQGSEDIAAWRWDRVHRVQFLHQPLGGSPQAGPIFNRSIANGGDKFTVNVASSFRNWEDYDQFHAAQYRQIVDFKHLWKSRWMIAPGQSGVPTSPHYDDLLERWQRVEYLPMR
ncbi:MAG: penicillin acylase family protein [Roseiflexaceae bacterium]|nr:penicillin acylase family protein [Roseiflexaceae bacterium]